MYTDIQSNTHMNKNTPCSFLRAGSMKIDLVTRQLTGLPGRPKNRTLLDLFSEELELEPEVVSELEMALGMESPRSRVAKVAGLPGFILILPKCTVPNFSNIGFTRSASPILT